MQSSATLRADTATSNRTGRIIWIALIAVSGIVLSVFFACATPFAALATLAALKVERRDTVTVVALVWLANQVIGYFYLGYPWTADSFAWGAAIGISAGLAVLAASALSTTQPASFVVTLPFIAAFAAYELALYVAGFVLPSEEAAYSPAVVWHLFLINTAALLALIVAYQLARAVGLLSKTANQQGLINAPLAG